MEEPGGLPSMGSHRVGQNCSDLATAAVYIYIYIHTHTHTHTIEYYSAIKKNEIMPFATTCMKIEMIVLAEVSQKMANTIYHLYVESII